LIGSRLRRFCVARIAARYPAEANAGLRILNALRVGALPQDSGRIAVRIN